MKIRHRKRPIVARMRSRPAPGSREFNRAVAAKIMNRQMRQLLHGALVRFTRATGSAIPPAGPSFPTLTVRRPALP